MYDRYAVRNIRLCTKDCLCLYVCPSGASDTENSIIDVNKCGGCGVCAAACPSHAISMMPRNLPPQQKHSDEVISAVKTVITSKSEQEKIAEGLHGRLGSALRKSNRIMTEDLLRESGFMLSQSRITHELLKNLLEDSEKKGFPRHAVESLLKIEIID